MATLQSTEQVCRVIKSGVVPYRKAWRWQIDVADRVREGSAPETLLLLEHPHTYTRGRLSPDSDLLLDESALTARGVEVVETDRGGLITYHGPGQLVVYPIIRLRGRGGPHWYVRMLEQVVVQSLAQFGLTSRTVDRLTGVWTMDGQRKIAAIGVKIAGGVAYHGLAINVNPDLRMFEGIVPCGIVDRGVSSMEAELQFAPSLDAVAEVVANTFCAELRLGPKW